VREERDVALTQDRSAYAPSKFPALTFGPGTLTENDRIAADPGFADAANGDFHLRVDSRLVDAGTPGSVAADATDLDGKPRASDGNGDCSAVPDVGAFEVQGTSPASCFPAPDPGPVVPPPPVPGKPTPAPVAPKLSKVKVKAGKRRVATIKFTLSGPARVELRFSKVGRRGELVTLKTRVKLKAKAGANLSRVRLGPGRYRVIAVATASGLTSKPATKAFKVVKRT
jgi:hypothetical protein